MKTVGIRRNVLLQYSVVTLIVIALVSAVLGIVLAKQTALYEMEAHTRLYPEIIAMAVRGDPSLPQLLSGPPGTPVSDENEQVLRSFLRLGGVYRVKAWSPDLRIVWSDQNDLVGQQFKDDDRCTACLLANKVVAEIHNPDDGENVDERAAGISLEIYTPVRGPGGKLAGVIEVYEANAELVAQMARAARFVWLSVLGGGALLYALLFIVFLQSWRRQRIADERLFETQEVTIRTLARQADLRDENTGRHIERTARYVRILAERLARLPEFRGYLTPRYIDDLVKSAPLHDIGKVGVKDAILLKPGPLTSGESTEMRRHCELGAQVLSEAQRDLPGDTFLTLAAQLAFSHHENWDGSGYPRGLSGEQIPLSARIMALADVYDALRTPRSYKPGLTHEECCTIISGKSGTAFDPRIVDAFLARNEEFRSVSCELSDVPSCPGGGEPVPRDQTAGNSELPSPNILSLRSR